jgi:hypothetical protein
VLVQRQLKAIIQVCAARYEVKLERCM